MVTSTATLPLRQRARTERGVALIVTMLAMSLLMALALALTLTTMTDRTIATAYARGLEATYAADAALERAIDDLGAAADWDAVLNGAAVSSFVDGPAGGMRQFPGGPSFDLTEATNQVRCGKAFCAGPDLIAVTDDRPWGANNPVWQLYAYGRLDAIARNAGISSDFYVIVWAGDDPAESDADPLRDGAPPPGCDPGVEPGCDESNIGRGVITVLAQARAADGAQSSIEATVARPEPGRPGVRLLSWRVRR